MSETHHCIGHVSTPYGDAAILIGRYLTGTAVGGAIAVQLVEDGDATQPLATFSVNLDYYSAALADDAFTTPSGRNPLGCLAACIRRTV
jgi:hypothetical protein